MTATRIPPAPELLRARTTLTYVLEALQRLDEWAKAAADVNHLVAEGQSIQQAVVYAGLVERLRDEIRAARNDHEQGTPATIARVVRQLLGEEPPDPDDREDRP